MAVTSSSPRTAARQDLGGLQARHWSPHASDGSVKDDPKLFAQQEAEHFFRAMTGC
jgi:hypothetical protein